MLIHVCAYTIVTETFSVNYNAAKVKYNRLTAVNFAHIYRALPYNTRVILL